MKDTDHIIEYYGKFNEEKRFDSRHGQVEYRITMKYIREYLDELERQGMERRDIHILDIGAGTGRYSVPLAVDGYDVSAIELVKHNLSRLKCKSDLVHARLGDARNLSKYEDDSFDLTLVFGPMYHLFTVEDKLKVLTEAKRVTGKNGCIMVAYCMNEYGVVMYALKEGHLKELKESGRLDADFHCHSEAKDLYDYVRLDDIDELNARAGLKRIKIISPDGPTNYIRPCLKAMTEDEFDIYLDYVASIAERSELIGAAAHVVDILGRD
ncbi:MAG: class I SAM-dependent methyltransferase [Lachnospiraceae bacterium]|nr:class I SAM-dependent methyltransferase [Lachnospiraceae bacterium]